MHTFYPLERLRRLVIGFSIATLSAAIVAVVAAPGNASPIVVTAAAPSATFIDRTVDDYQPPDNGGPGRTGGSGTR